MFFIAQNLMHVHRTQSFLELLKKFIKFDLLLINSSRYLVFRDYFSRSSFPQRCSVKKVFLKNSQNSMENTCVRVFFLLKPETLFKKVSDAGVFLGIVGNF